MSEDFLEEEVRTAVKENRPVVLSKSRPVLRDRVVCWIKELILNPAVCGVDCCRTGFQRAGIFRVVCGQESDNIEVDVAVPEALRLCSECGERGKLVYDLPGCHHFEDVEKALLCDGCLNNHESLCLAAD